MYFILILATMVVLPVGFALVELLTHGRGATAPAVWGVLGKWYVFWGVGIRLFLAGLRQTLQPRFTAETILGIHEPRSMIVVRELGFANVSIGAVGIVSLALAGWRPPAAAAGAIFYGLAAVNHSLRSHRNRLENAAMISGFLMLAVLLLYLFGTVVRNG